VDAGRTIRIADGAQASAGDLIICRANDHHFEAGEPGRALAHGDILRIEAITRGATATASSSRPRSRPGTTASFPTGPDGCTALCTPPNSLG
jgi:hypothetical protein